MKPIMFLDADAFMSVPDGKAEQEKIQAAGYVVVFLKPGSKSCAIFPPPETNGHRKKGKR